MQFGVLLRRGRSQKQSLQSTISPIEQVQLIANDRRTAKNATPIPCLYLASLLRIVVHRPAVLAMFTHNDYNNLDTVNDIAKSVRFLTALLASYRLVHQAICSSGQN